MSALWAHDNIHVRVHVHFRPCPCPRQTSTVHIYMVGVIKKEKKEQSNGALQGR